MTCLIASPNSKWVVTGSRDGTIIVWDAECGKVTHEWFAHCGDVKSLGFSPDSQHLASAGGESGETLVVWDISNGVRKVAVLASIDQEKDVSGTAVDWCAWSPAGTLIASASIIDGLGMVRTWHVLTFQLQRGLPVLAVKRPMSEAGGHYDAESLQSSPDFRYLAWRSTTYKLEVNGLAPYHEWAIWNPLTDAPPKRLPLHGPTHPEAFVITALSFDPESRHIATAGICQRYTCSNAGGSEGISEGDGPNSDRHSSYLQIWDVASGTLLVVLGHMRPVCHVSFSPDGRSLLSLSEDGSMKIRDTDSWQETASLEGDGGWPWKACFSPDGRYVAIIVSKSSTCTVRLWRIGEASCVAVFTEHKATITCFALTPNGQFLAFGDYDGIVHIRRLSNFIGH